MSPREFLVLAQTLANAPGEAAWRSAASRAYYASFHVARELLESLGFPVPPDEKAHAYVWLRLSNCGHAPTQHAGAGLKSLRQDRTTADYRLHRSFTQALAQAAARSAEQIIQSLDAVVSPVRAPITDAMKTYERDVLQQVTWRP
jgi:uncharacterized protein (UPF0332 family)